MQIFVLEPNKSQKQPKKFTKEGNKNRSKRKVKNLNFFAIPKEI